MNRIVKTLLALSAVVGGILTANQPVHAITHYVQSSTPTIFVHGWGSSSHAEEKMANYQSDYTAGYHHGGTYVRNVVQALQKQHHYRQINLVGHSMGNLEIINYINYNYDNANLPKVAHLVAIAGHYNGLVGQRSSERATINRKTGEPSSMDPSYRELLGLRQHFPTGTAVLNIYGNLDDGSNSDSDVPVTSAQSLKYLVGNRAKSYQEIELHGKSAQHSRLHNNNHQVDQALIKFLWEK